MRFCARQNPVEACVQPGLIGFQGRVPQMRPLLSDSAGASQQMAQIGRDDGVALIDGVLHIADQMGEADLMFLARKTHLPAIAVRNPLIGPDIAQELRNHGLGARRLGLEDRAVTVMEHP